MTDLECDRGGGAMESVGSLTESGIPRIVYLPDD